MEQSTVTDEQLMAAIGLRDRRALATLVQRHQERALRLAYRTLGHWDLAEDIAQEAFLRIYKTAPRYRPEARFSTWFYRIIVNLCLDHLRRHQRRTRLALEKNTPSGESGSNPVETETRKETVQAVQRALADLSDRERLLVTLHRFEGQSHRQIAAITDSTASAVESVLVRAYRKLREKLVEFRESA